MANPLDAFRNLKGWQKGAVALGGAGVVALVVYESKKAKKPAATAAAPAPAAGTTAATAGETEDPSTGLFYPDGEVDPETGDTYAGEIGEYGSVSAADAASGSAADQAALQNETPQQYDEQIGQEAPAPATGATVTTNAQWMAEVETGLSEQGYSAGDIGQALAAYFGGKPLGTSSDGTSLYTIINLAVSEYGPPPTGSYPVLLGPATTTPPPAAADQVTVPNVVGQAQEAGFAILSAAGLHATGTKTIPGKTLTVDKQNPPAGAKVAKGTTVTLTSAVAK